jgi:hypothetical protein
MLMAGWLFWLVFFQNKHGWWMHESGAEVEAMELIKNIHVPSWLRHGIDVVSLPDPITAIYSNGICPRSPEVSQDYNDVGPSEHSGLGKLNAINQNIR